MQSVACQMKEDMMSTIGHLNKAGSLMRRAHQILITEEGGIAQRFKDWQDSFDLVEAKSTKAEFSEDAVPILSVDNSRYVRPYLERLRLVLISSVLV